MKKLLPAVMLASLSLFSASAQAGAWEAKTMRAPLSSREVERPLIIGKGWLEFGLQADYKAAQGEWGPSGEKVDWEEGTTFLYTTEALSIRYGLFRRGEIYWNLPVHYIGLENNAGSDHEGWYLGDPRFGYLYEFYRSDAPLTSAIVRFEYKAPAGNESPGSYIAGPSTFRSFVTTTGTSAFRLSVEGKRQFGLFAVEGGVGYQHNFSGLAQYLLETTYNQFQGRIKPGGQLLLNARGTAQLGPVAPYAGLWTEMHQDVKMGTTSPGLLPDRNLEAVADSGGYSYGVDVGLTLNATRNIDLVLNASVPLYGEDLMFFPIEDLHPTRGNTYSGGLEFRY